MLILLCVALTLTTSFTSISTLTQRQTTHLLMSRLLSVEEGISKQSPMNSAVSLHHSLSSSKQSNHTDTSAESSLHEMNNLDVPRHIAFICDGNSRWAELNSLPKSIGHAAGADRVINVISYLRKYRTGQKQLYPNSNTSIEHKRVQYCTLFAFSTENWSRSKSEIDAIFKLIEKVAIQYQQHDAIKNGQIEIRILGDLNDDRIPVGTKTALNKLQSDSKQACDDRMLVEKECDVLTVCLAINYGGRKDILQAAAKLAQSISSGELTSDSMDDTEISKRLSTSSIPDPDLIIRTGGEKRLSNFLLWNAAYAELYFSDTLWPDFNDDSLAEAILWYGRRNRRYGGRTEL